MTTINIEKVFVRRAEYGDLVSVADIYNQGIDNRISTFDEDYVSCERYLHYLDTGNIRSFLLVAEYDNQLIGWTSIDPISVRYAYKHTSLSSTFMRKGFSGRRYAKLLSARKFVLAEHLDYHSIIAEVLSINNGAIRFLLDLDYTIVGEIMEAGYRDGRWIGLTIMQKML